MQDDDFSLFKSEMRGVKQIKHDRADTGKPKADRKQLASLRQNATVRTDQTVVDGLSDQFVIDVGPEDDLHWSRDGVQESQMRKLKVGQIPFEGSLDLHGMRANEARPAVERFLVESLRAGQRCVLVVHGRGHISKDRTPVLKEKLVSWLARSALSRSPDRCLSGSLTGWQATPR